LKRREKNAKSGLKKGRHEREVGENLRRGGGSTSRGKKAKNYPERGKVANIASGEDDLSGGKSERRKIKWPRWRGRPYYLGRGGEDRSAQNGRAVGIGGRFTGRREEGITPLRGFSSRKRKKMRRQRGRVVKKKRKEVQKEGRSRRYKGQASTWEEAKSEP